ncbi:hypothetical protein E3N88_34675 [Mikania micrantha]|uniref:FAR1 domain-containing protein n=1 Tax=Mikania micrantha TaxID=192012 RepID=A0A5N6LYU5_9ASTR|nr:hypothetical protein E3N88_34675 [Mikania micrantha]
MDWCGFLGAAYGSGWSQVRSQPWVSSCTLSHISGMNDLGNHGTTIASSCVDVIDSSGGNRYWIPDVPNELKPIKGVVFSSFEEARRIYDRYADHSGFSTRLATIKRKKGEITHRYIVCNKAGKSKNISFEYIEGHDDGIAKRKTKTKVTNCLACVKFKAIPGTSRYSLYKFVEAHNHNLLEDVNKDFSKAKRKLQYADKKFIYSLSTTNTGPSTAYRMRTVSSGGQIRVHGNIVDFRNFRRDMNHYIGERDAQMLVDKMSKRMENDPDLSFDFKCDQNELILLFWADEVTKINYQFMVSFEAAMDDQRFSQKKLDHDSNTSTPTFKTHLPIERFAARVYTHEIFIDVQNEIWKGVWCCAQKSFADEDGYDVYVIRHKDKRSNVIADFKFLGVDVIPDRYVLHRWRKDALPHDTYRKQQRCRIKNDERDDLFYEAVSIVESCASRLRGDIGKLALFVKKLKDMEHDIFIDIPHEPKVNSNEEVFKAFLEVSSPEKVSIKILEGARNKGCGTNKRMVGPGEKVVAKIKKRNPRTCKICKKYVFHDSRTCSLNPKNIKKDLKSKTTQKCSTSKQPEPDDIS